MRRVLPVILAVLLLVVSMVPSIAKAETEIVIDARFLKIKMIVDGIPEDSSMVVNLTVGHDKEDDSKWATWDSIFIMSDIVEVGKGLSCARITMKRVSHLIADASGI